MAKNTKSATQANKLRALSKDIQPKQLSKIISDNNELLELAIDNPRIDIHDVKAVIGRSKSYLHFCSDRAISPTMKGLANYCDYSYRTFENHITDGTETGEFLEKVRDRIKDNLEQAALSNAVNNISAMFILKTTHGYVEANKVVLEPSDKLLGQPKNYEELSQLIDENITDV